MNITHSAIFLYLDLELPPADVGLQQETLRQ